jgi:hypothetical protein
MDRYWDIVNTETSAPEFIAQNCSKGHFMFRNYDIKLLYMLINYGLVHLLLGQGHNTVYSASFYAFMAVTFQDLNLHCVIHYADPIDKLNLEQ